MPLNLHSSSSCTVCFLWVFQYIPDYLVHVESWIFLQVPELWKGESTKWVGREKGAFLAEEACVLHTAFCSTQAIMKLINIYPNHLISLVLPLCGLCAVRKIWKWSKVSHIRIYSLLQHLSNYETLNIFSNHLIPLVLPLCGLWAVGTNSKWS